MMRDPFSEIDAAAFNVLNYETSIIQKRKERSVRNFE